MFWLLVTRKIYHHRVEYSVRVMCVVLWGDVVSYAIFVALAVCLSMTHLLDQQCTSSSPSIRKTPI